MLQLSPAKVPEPWAKHSTIGPPRARHKARKEVGAEGTCRDVPQQPGVHLTHTHTQFKVSRPCGLHAAHQEVWYDEITPTRPTATRNLHAILTIPWTTHNHYVKTSLTDFTFERNGLLEPAVALTTARPILSATPARRLGLGNWESRIFRRSLSPRANGRGQAPSGGGAARGGHGDVELRGRGLPPCLCVRVCSRAGLGAWHLAHTWHTPRRFQMNCCTRARLVARRLASNA